MFQPLRGFRDFYPEDCAVRNHIFRVWRQTARSFAFREFDAPVVEPLALLTAKSGPEIVSQLFNFTDKGGEEVTLRPELTPSMARMVGAKAASLKKPVRWFGIAEMFRYEAPQKGRLRSHYQLNGDLLGEPGPAADAEIIALAVQTLRAFGLGPRDFRVRLSDRDLWMLFLEAFGFQGETALAVLQVVDKMERVEPEKTLEALRRHAGEQAETLAERFRQLQAAESLDELTRRFPQMGIPAEMKPRVEARVGQFRELFERLDELGVGEFCGLDLRVVRGLAYYTGFVFEAFRADDSGRALAGGGRYDHLVEKLGGPPTPAVGFGMGDVTLRDILEETGKLPRLIERADVYIIYRGEGTRQLALGLATPLREAGIHTAYAMKEQAFGKQFKQADESGALFALIIGPDEAAQQQVKLQDLRGKAEETVPAAQAVWRVIEAVRSGGLSPED